MHSPSKPELHEFFDDVKTFIKSENFHKLIVALVIVDCLCVASELLLLEISKYVMQNGQQKVLCMAKTLNTTHHFLNKSSELNQHKNDSHHGSSPELHLFFEISEDILKYISTSILGLFCIELVVKLMLIPQIFVKSKWEILDGFVVFVSFSLNIFLIVLGDTMESVTGLLVLLRLWRIGEIVNGTIVAIETKHDIKVEALEKTIKKLKDENEDLKNQLNPDSN